ncbi:MAG TPA: lanthionine synthetase LanC family protein, partial [Solirubrobacteraceae bacterium]|nr:lanthionine synthetase LanC family protein [Solirubrobacteraceae bacterium]
MTPDREPLLRGAARIGAALCREAVWAGDRCAWVARVEEGAPAGAWRAEHRATGPDLHGGSAGIALFLAHLHALTGEPVFRMTALGAAAHAASRLEDVPPPARAGLHGGWAGIAWALDEVARATGEDGPARRAREALRALAEGGRSGDAPPRPGDPAPDVMSGGAGGIAALLRLAGDDDASPLVDLAVREGERLLALAVRGPAGWSWRTIGGPGEPHLC